MQVMDNGIVRDATEDELAEITARAQPKIENLVPQYISAVQCHLDRTAQSYGYDDIAVAVTYAEEPAVPKFQAEGRALRAWRSLVWDKCHEILAQVKAGEIDIPSVESVVENLPELDLPREQVDEPENPPA